MRNHLIVAAANSSEATVPVMQTIAIVGPAFITGASLLQMPQ